MSIISFKYNNYLLIQQTLSLSSIVHFFCNYPGSYYI